MCTEARGPGPRVLSAATVCTTMLVSIGCNGTTSYLDATGTAGRHEAVLGWWLSGAACAVVLLVCAALLASVARHRGEGNASDGRAASTERREIRSGLRWIYLGTAATVVVLLVTFAGTMVTLHAASRVPREPDLTMEVVGHQWWWEVRYRDARDPASAFTTANEVHLPIGRPVRVRLRTADVIHSFWLPQIAGKTDLIPGQTNEMWLEAREPGTSRGACGEYCGLQHAMMAMSVTAESPERFARWVEERRAPAGPPNDDEARIGQAVVVRSCGACHAVVGTNALGRIGPDLTHVASRSTIGAGALANTPANLERWIRNAPSVKEGARMPAIPLDAASLRAVVAYLQTLR